MVDGTEDETEGGTADGILGVIVGLVKGLDRGVRTNKYLDGGKLQQTWRTSNVNHIYIFLLENQKCDCFISP